MQPTHDECSYYNYNLDNCGARSAEECINFTVNSTNNKEELVSSCKLGHVYDKSIFQSTIVTEVCIQYSGYTEYHNSRVR